ncbi:MAG TPA: hypothetical protein VK676_04575 [Steroidobacteraceae bacterium]|nr:hypothetical protein [Steroidobacteraceae bacterium]
MNPFTTLLCIVILGAALLPGVPAARTPAACAPPSATQPGAPAQKAPASSFAPHAASRHHAYGAPIQAPILKRHPHRRHVGRDPKHSPPAPT